MSSSPVPQAPSGLAAFHALLYGILITGTGLIICALGVVLQAFCLLLEPSDYLLSWAQRTIWYGGVPVSAGVFLILFDLFVLLPLKRSRPTVPWEPPCNTNLTVVLTAYNDELSIALAVRDFVSHPKVKRVIVIDNNSKDRTPEAARAAGAQVLCEVRPGYGSCVWRALEQGSKQTDTELTLLCEGDMTFRAYDIDKFLCYAPHAEIVNGTRIVEQLREHSTQLTTFMYFGNFFAAKLLEAKHIGKGTLTDLGTTYKLCRNSSLMRLLPLLNPGINYEFNAHFLDVAMAKGFSIVECPITFHNRVGASKGGNVSNGRAIKVGLRMIWGIVFGWKALPR